MAGRVAARRGRSTLALLVAVTLLGLAAPPPRAGAQIDQVLHPVGGGYSDATVGHFVQTVIDHATGERVRILIIPSAYDHTSLGYAKQHVDRFEAVCASLLGATSRFAQGCEAALVPLWSRPDAEDPANVASIADPETDGIFFLGGDQGVAMEIIAGTAAERAMEAGYRRGVVVGGTSAGTAVESRTMIADYANGGGPATGLERGKVLIWWGDDADLERGLSFGSRRVVFDQHFYQRGRLGRSLNAVAESMERLGEGGLLGVGVDYATSADLTDDGLLSEVAGSSSVMVIDFAQATHRWVGPLQTLSARGVLTQVLPAGPYGYDVARRAPLVAGAPVSTVDPGPWPADLFPTGPGAVILGGDLLDGGDGLRQFVDRARATGRSRIVLVVAGYPSTGDAESEARAYVQALRALGWTDPAYQIEVLDYEASTAWAGVSPGVVDGAAGVAFVGGDQSELARPLGDPTFAALVRAALARAPVVLTDRAMTPAMGDVYLANPDPTVKDVESQAIAAFRSGWADLRPGLGIVHAALEPRLTADQRWGRLYGLASEAPGSLALGISERTGILIEGGTASVIGERSVVVLDGRAATFVAGTNGAIGAFGVRLNLYAPGEAVEP